MKKYLLFAAAITVMAGCTNDSVVESTPDASANNVGKAIVFNSSSSAVTRADYTGLAAAEKLNNNFVVQGVKGDGTAQEIVFNNYNVNL